MEIANLKSIITYWLTRIAFLFRPKYHVFTSIQAALKTLPNRGGTLVLGVGDHKVGMGLALPLHKPLRIVGGRFVGVGESLLNCPESGHIMIEGATFEHRIHARPIFDVYLALESAMRRLEDISDPRADKVRSVMETIRLDLTDGERNWLDQPYREP